MLKSYNYRNALLVTLLMVILLPLFLLAPYTHLTADDYMDAVALRQYSILSTFKTYYMGQGGRYFGFLVDASINPGAHYAEWTYKYIPIFFLSLFMIAAYWLSRQLQNKRATLAVASLLCIAFLSFLPDVGQGLFWQTGVIATFIPDILTLFLLGSMIKYYSSDNKRLYLIISCLLATAIIGCYEISMVFIDLTLSVFALYKLVKRQNLVFPLTILAICILFSLIEVMAPGNSARGHLFPKSHRLAYAFNQSYVYSKEILVHYWLPYMLFLGILLFDVVSEHFESLPAYFTSIFNFPPWLTLIACMLIPFIGMFINFWAEGMYPLLRTINVFYFYFILAMIYFLVSCSMAVTKHYPGFKLPVYIKVPCYLLLVYITIFKSANVKAAYKDIYSGTAATFSRQLDERETYLLNTKDDSCIVTPIKQVPASFYYLDIQPDPKHWLDTNICKYYHKKYIGLKS